jgi:hypothetical protein
MQLDIAPADLATPTDIALPPDVAVAKDLAAPPDAAWPTDLTGGPDSSVPVVSLSCESRLAHGKEHVQAVAFDSNGDVHAAVPTEVVKVPKPPQVPQSLFALPGGAVGGMAVSGTSVIVISDHLTKGGHSTVTVRSPWITSAQYHEVNARLSRVVFAGGFAALAISSTALYRVPTKLSGPPSVVTVNFGSQTPDLRDLWHNGGAYRLLAKVGSKMMLVATPDLTPQFSNGPPGEWRLARDINVAPYNATLLVDAAKKTSNLFTWPTGTAYSLLNGISSEVRLVGREAGKVFFTDGKLLLRFEGTHWVQVQRSSYSPQSGEKITDLALSSSGLAIGIARGAGPSASGVVQVCPL